DDKTGALLRDDATLKKARGKLLQCWQGNYQIDGEGTDPYLQRLLRTLNSSSEQEMIEQAERWLLSLLQHHCPG
ncbi:MAG TPA: hypothetical protein DDY50_12425, partial [Erwinia persicina]|nr:hypothetical protein [Erwinia persicina]